MRRQYDWLDATSSTYTHPEYTGIQKLVD
jgi:hypothetical protein